ncbi:hypothetical protein [Streptomyces sp. NPDC057702]|uniref:hypothetical protein n=1 Tax=unclassified Streptomyces TaxID=2593676 RepID=UPI0036AD9617
MRNAAIGSAAALAVLAGLVAAGPTPAVARSATEKVSATAAGAPKSARTASVDGSARVFYVESPDDDIRFTVHARQRPFTLTTAPRDPRGMATDAVGTLRIRHTTRDGSVGWATAEVDCLVTSGRTATLTAVVTESNAEEVGARLGVSVQQGTGGAPDRLGFSWGVVNVDPGHVDDQGRLLQPQAGSCMAPAPFTTVVRGGFTVRHAEIRKNPGRVQGADRRG